MPAAVHIGDDVIPTAMNIGEEVNPAAVDSDLDVLDGGFTWAEAPQYGETTGGPHMAEEEEKEHFMTVGCDPTGDDPTGADEEWRYFKTVPDDEVQKRKRARTIPEIREFDTETVLDDEATILNDFFVPHTSHDKENPIIKVGDTFIDKSAFVYNIKQYAIKNQFDPGFKMIPPKLERPASRPRKKRIKASGETGKIGPYQCKRCFQFGHIEKGCNATQAELEQELSSPRPKNSKRKRKSKSEIESSANDPQVTLRPSATTTNMSSLSPTSPGPTTRSMSSLSPTSPGPTTRSMSSLSPTSSCPRRMASISPGGINRSIIIS